MKLPTFLRSVRLLHRATGCCMCWGFEGLFYGNDNTNLLLFIGLIPLLCIGICGGLMVNLFKIRNRVF